MKVRRDANESEVLRALRQVTLHVYQVRTALPAGCPDVFVWACGAWHGLEVKSERGKLSAEQQRLVEIGAVSVVRTPLEALEAIGVVSGEAA